jgi:Phytanoyl-CoA dioxygenase (PhyH)
VTSRSYRLDDDETRRLAAEGFVLREGVFPAADVAAMTGACERLVADLVRDRIGRRVRAGSYVFDTDLVRHTSIKWEGDSDVVHGIEPFAHLDPALRDWGYDPRIVEPVIGFIGDEKPELYTEKLNLKRPHHGGVNPFHQDFPYWVDVADDPTRLATAMIFLDDATRENGCLEVIPGSHRRGRWPTRTDGDAFGQNELDPKEAEGQTVVPIEVPAGSVVFFGPFLVHKSEPNRSERERRALLYSYMPAGHTALLTYLRRQAEEYAERKRRKAAAAAAQSSQS